jgi:hypothetical protein
MKNREEINDLRTHLIRFQNLKRSEAWEQFDLAMKAYEQQAYAGMVQSETEASTLKAVGAYHALKNMREWLDMQISTLRFRLNQLGEVGEEQD